LAPFAVVAEPPAIDTIALAPLVADVRITRSRAWSDFTNWNAVLDAR
jgi:hypothetical protein